MFPLIRFLAISFAMSGALFFASCAERDAPPAAGLFSEGIAVRSNDPKWKDVGLNTVRVLDKSLNGRILVQYAGAQFAKDARLQAYAMVQNLEDNAIVIEARGHFFNRRQEPIEEGAIWTEVVLGPKAVTPFRVLSQVKRDPSYFVLDIRLAQIKQ